MARCVRVGPFCTCALFPSSAASSCSSVLHRPRVLVLATGRCTSFARRERRRCLTRGSHASLLDSGVAHPCCMPTSTLPTRCLRAARVHAPRRESLLCTRLSHRSPGVASACARAFSPRRVAAGGAVDAALCAPPFRLSLRVRAHHAHRARSAAWSCTLSPCSMRASLAAAASAGVTNAVRRRPGKNLLRPAVSTLR